MVLPRIFSGNYNNAVGTCCGRKEPWFSSCVNYINVSNVASSIAKHLETQRNLIERVIFCFGEEHLGFERGQNVEVVIFVLLDSNATCGRGETRILERFEAEVAVHILRVRGSPDLSSDSRNSLTVAQFVDS